jgi:hypothetical protein
LNSNLAHLVVNPRSRKEDGKIQCNMHACMHCGRAADQILFNAKSNPKFS